ncbi:MAG: putative membrane protein [Rhodobacteraceae bacterium HLUCCA12]|nr:MAG: putative membrane protein [Rhodobacteraceae bacterium HLUCCA12]
MIGQAIETLYADIVRGWHRAGTRSLLTGSLAALGLLTPAIIALAFVVPPAAVAAVVAPLQLGASLAIAGRLEGRAQ